MSIREHCLSLHLRVIMGPRVGSIFVAQVGSAIFSLGLGLENFPKKSQIFKKKFNRVKKMLWVWSKSTQDRDRSASFLLRAKSMHYAGVQLDQGPSLHVSPYKL